MCLGGGETRLYDLATIAVPHPRFSAGSTEAGSCARDRDTLSHLVYAVKKSPGTHTSNVALAFFWRQPSRMVLVKVFIPYQSLGQT